MWRNEVRLISFLPYVACVLHLTFKINVVIRVLLFRELRHVFLFCIFSLESFSTVHFHSAFFVLITSHAPVFLVIHLCLCRHLYICVFSLPLLSSQHFSSHLSSPLGILCLCLDLL